MCRRRHRAGRCCRTYDLAALGKRSQKLHSHLEPNAAIPLDRDVATYLRLLRTHDIPDQPATLRHHAREFGRARLASDHCEGNTTDLPELNRGRRHEIPLIALPWTHFRLGVYQPESAT
jgi:hypothetical protein